MSCDYKGPLRSYKVEVHARSHPNSAQSHSEREIKNQYYKSCAVCRK